MALPNSDTKAVVRAMLDTMPDDITFEDVMEALVVQFKAREGVHAFEEGRTYDHEDVVQKLPLRP